ncbi:hypothetical protein BV25DRAFT_1761949, partial [Artomyces pyxidatus]
LPSEPFLICALLVAVILHVICGVSSVHSHLVLHGFRAAIAGALVFQRPGWAPDEVQAFRSQITNSMPGDIRTALSKFQLDPEIVFYACC